MPHRLYLPDLEPPAVGAVIDVVGDEARHAVVVKRVALGEPVELRNGRGLVAEGQATDLRPPKGRGEASLSVQVTAARVEPPASPRVEVWSATPKGDRLEQMIDQLSQVGATSWRPLRTQRGVVDPREGKLGRLERVAVEACKQSGRAWVLTIDAPADLSAGLVAGAGTTVLLADAEGESSPRPMAGDAPGTLRVLIGPEGGFTPDERQAARQAGVQLWRCGAHIMRTETAAVVAAARLMSAASGSGQFVGLRGRDAAG